MTFDAASWSLLLGVVAFTAACGGDDDSASAPDGSSIVATTLGAARATSSADEESATGSVADGATDAPAGDESVDSTLPEGVVDASTPSSVTGSTLTTLTTEPVVEGTSASGDTTSTGGSADGVAWTDPDGLFTVDFPAEPTATEVPVPDIGDGATLTAYIFENADGAFLANRTDTTTIDASVAEVSLQEAVAETLSFVGGTVGRSDDITIQGRDAIRFDFTVTGGVGEGLTVGDGLILYQLLGIGEESSRVELAAFVDSFTFTGGQP